MLISRHSSPTELSSLFYYRLISSYMIRICRTLNSFCQKDPMWTVLLTPKNKELTLKRTCYAVPEESLRDLRQRESRVPLWHHRRGCSCPWQQIYDPHAGVSSPDEKRRVSRNMKKTFKCFLTLISNNFEAVFLIQYITDCYK